MRSWLVVVAACGSPPAISVDAGVDGAPDASMIDAPAPIAVTITATVDSTRFVTREHMLAAGEMQISGEPLAEAMGRNLGGYSRDLLPVDIYLDPVVLGFWTDLPGFSTAVESYEYSKQPMNGLAFEYGAGTSLAHAPLVDFDGATGSGATAHVAAIVQQLAARSNATGKWVFAPGTFPVGNSTGDTNPNGSGSPADNPLGWPGMMPTAHVFRSFDPTSDPASTDDLHCTIASDDNPNETGESLFSADYECDAHTLHLRDRAAQIDATITPGADGFSAWKYGLWTLNYLQIMHDANNAAVSAVDAADLATVGVPGNSVVGADDGAVAGTYLGSSDIEGFQAGMFIVELDNRADDWLLHLTTTDGVTLTGFATLADALAYDDVAPLRWFPGEIAVAEDPDGAPSYTLASAASSALDLLGLAMGYSELYALTDTANPDVGGSQPARAYFDGDPFAADNQLADGEDTVHDRALAMIRVALVDLDRMHVDPATQLVADDATATARGHTLSTTTAAYTVIGLRTALRSLGSQLELYSNNLPDRAIGTTPLDALPLHAADPALTFSTRLEQLVRSHADLLLDHLTDASGRALAGWDLAANAPIDDSDIVDSHAAAIRGLFAGYLATGDTRYRDRAIAVFTRMEAVFYDPDARIYSVTPAPVDDVTFTPLRFALVQSALRDVYELVASRPGEESLEPLLENRLGRLNKLVLNGWDDRDRDKHVGWPDECANVVDGLPRGGLQMAERTLTGELGRLKDQGTGGGPPTSDRDKDCVPEIDDVHLPAALADSVTFHIARQP